MRLLLYSVIQVWNHSCANVEESIEHFPVSTQQEILSLCNKNQAVYMHVFCFVFLLAGFYLPGWVHCCVLLFLCMCMCMYAAAAAAASAPLTTCPGCGFSDSGGIARKSVAMSLVLSPMKRVQSSPNLGAGTNTHWHVSSQQDLRGIRGEMFCCCLNAVWLSRYA